MSMKSIPPHTPLLYRKTGECRGIPIFLSFAPKHRLWVLVRTASVRRSNVYPQSSKSKKNIKAFLMKSSGYTNANISKSKVCLASMTLLQTSLYQGN